MSFVSEEDWKKIREKPRDAKGKYVKKGVDPKDTVFPVYKTASPIDTLKEGPDEFLDKPLVSFSVNNPFKKILVWLKDIRKRQTTTFNFKISIPLIALPIFLLIVGGAIQFFFYARQARSKSCCSCTYSNLNS